MLQDFLAIYLVQPPPPPQYSIYLQFQTFVPDLFNLEHIF